MTRSEKITLARSMATLYTEDELTAKLRGLLETDGQRVTAWTDIGLSSSLSYDFTIPQAIECINAALAVKRGGKLRTKPTHYRVDL